MKDFFISYNIADKEWAAWIAWTLEDTGYSVVFQDWDFRPGGNFILEMQKAAQDTKRTLIVLSENYLKAHYTQPEWAAAFVVDPCSEKYRLLPVRVGVCSPKGLLKPLIYTDLVGLDATKAKQVLLLSVLCERGKPTQAPTFPGSVTKQDYRVERVKPRVVTFPKKSPFQAENSALSVWQEKLKFLKEQEALVVDAGLRYSVQKQIDEADRMIWELLDSFVKFYRHTPTISKRTLVRDQGTIYSGDSIQAEVKAPNDGFLTIILCDSRNSVYPLELFDKNGIRQNPLPVKAQSSYLLPSRSHGWIMDENTGAEIFIVIQTPESISQELFSKMIKKLNREKCRGVNGLQELPLADEEFERFILDTIAEIFSNLADMKVAKVRLIHKAALSSEGLSIKRPV